MRLPHLKDDEEYCPKCNGYGVTVTIVTEGSFDPADEETYGALKSCDVCKGTGKRIDRESNAYLRRMLLSVYEKFMSGKRKPFIYPYTEGEDIRSLVHKGYIRQSGYTRQGQYLYTFTQAGEDAIERLKREKKK